MSSVVAGSNHLVVAFYSAYLEMLDMENTYYNSIAIAIKRAIALPDVENIFIVLETREDYLAYSKLKNSIDEHSKNTFLICMNEEIRKLATSPRTITFNHKALTMDFTSTLSKMHICKPYLQEDSKGRSPEKLLEYIKFMLLKGSITLPVKNECAVSVLAALDEDEVSFKEIDKMTKTDPVLHSGILKMANSVFFSGAFSSIKDVEKALIRVGLSNVKVFLINFINKSLAANADLALTDEINDAIENSIKTACLCYVMAERFKVASPVSMFSIGLLSKIGEIFIYAAISDYFSGDDLKETMPLEYIKLAKNNGTKVSGMLLKKWKFSEEYYQPILYSHNLEQNSHINETRILYMASHMLDYFDEGIITEKVQEVLIKCQICLGEDHLLKMRRDAIDNFIKLKGIL